jgi:hypothetical protein
MGLDAVHNGDGTHRFVVRSDLNLNHLSGTHITHPTKGIRSSARQVGNFLPEPYSVESCTMRRRRLHGREARL